MKQFLLRQSVDFIRNFLTRLDVKMHLYHVLHRIIPDYLLLSSYHDILAIIVVSTNMDFPHEWPPLFGSISQVYTIRNCWSLFWHLWVYRSFNAAAVAFSQALGIKMPGARYLNNAFVFVLSRLMHALVDWKMLQGSSCSCWGMASWFWCQIVGIAVEDLGQKARMLVELQVLGSGQIYWLRLVKRIIGYLWVMTWLLWSVPRSVCSEMNA